MIFGNFVFLEYLNYILFVFICLNCMYFFLRVRLFDFIFDYICCGYIVYLLVDGFFKSVVFFYVIFIFYFERIISLLLKRVFFFILVFIVWYLLLIFLYLLIGI